MKVLGDYFCLITHVVPSPFSPYHTTLFLLFSFWYHPYQSAFLFVIGLLEYHNTFSILIIIMKLSEVFITLHMYYPHPLYSSPISRFYFTSLRFYSIFTSPFYYCYNILDGFYPPFFFHLDYVSFSLLHPFGYLSLYLSVSPLQLSLKVKSYG